MDTVGVDQFVVWVRDNINEISALVQAVGTASKSDDKEGLYEAFIELDEVVGSRLYDLGEELALEVGPGRSSEQALIISAGGLYENVPTVQRISEGLKDLDGLEVVGFKPARGIDNNTLAAYDLGGVDNQLSLEEISFKLLPQVNKIDIDIFFADKDTEEGDFSQLTFDLLDFLLGEYQVIEGIGEITFSGSPEGVEGLHPILTLSEAFDEAKKNIKRQYAKLVSATPEGKLQDFIESNQEQIARIGKAIIEKGAAGVDLHLALWSSKEETQQQIQTLLPGNEVIAEPSLSLLGNGYQLNAVFTEEKIADLAEWLSQRILPLIQGSTIILGVTPIPEIPAVMIPYIVPEFYARGEFQEGIDLINRVLAESANQSESDLYGLLGIGLTELEQFPEALEALNRAIELEIAQEGESHLNAQRGWVLYKLGRTDEAIADYEIALEEDRDAVVLVNTGLAYAAKEDFEKSCGFVAEALELEPGLLEDLLVDEDFDALRKSEPFKKLLATVQQ